MMMKSLNDRARGLLTSPLASSDIMYWRGDLF